MKKYFTFSEIYKVFGKGRKDPDYNIFYHKSNVYFIGNFDQKRYWISVVNRSISAEEPFLSSRYLQKDGSIFYEMTPGAWCRSLRQAIQRIKKL